MYTQETPIRRASSSAEVISGRDFYKLHVEEPAFNNLRRWHWDSVQALDISSGDDTIARHLERRGVNPGSIDRLSLGFSRLLKSNNLATGFQPESIDVITANMTFHHMGDRHLKTTVGHLGELLKTGGQLLFVGPNPEVYREVFHGRRRVRQQMFMHVFEKFNPGYVNTIREAAPHLELSYLKMPTLMVPKYNPDPRAEVSYRPYGEPSMRIAGLLIKTPQEDVTAWPPLLEAGTAPAIEDLSFLNLIDTVA
jgi:hypothetical protein